MTPDFEAALRKRYFELVFDIKKFLSDPINESFKASYSGRPPMRFNLKIICEAVRL